MRGPSYMPVLWSAPRYSAARGDADYDQFCANERHGQLGNLGESGSWICVPISHCPRWR
jgi:hypothetical protein